MNFTETLDQKKEIIPKKNLFHVSCGTRYRGINKTLWIFISKWPSPTCIVGQESIQRLTNIWMGNIFFMITSCIHQCRSVHGFKLPIEDEPLIIVGWAKSRKMQLDVGNEPYLSQQLCLDHLLIKSWFFLECSQRQALTYGHIILMYLYELPQCQVERTSMALFVSS